jgi:ABC-2 type transport system ATP-binding protein
VIINKGKLVANEKTENISAVVEKSRRFHAKICGPQKEILTFLRGMSGLSYAEVLAERDGDAYTYLIESEYGVDIRKKLFYELAARNWALIGLEALGMNLEDIFIAIVDQSTAAKNRYARKDQKVERKKSAESEFAKNATETAAKKRGGDYSTLFDDDDE